MTLPQEEEDLFNVASQRRGVSLPTETTYPLLFPSFSSHEEPASQGCQVPASEECWACAICAGTRKPVEAVYEFEDEYLFYADCNELYAEKLSSEQIKAGLELMQSERMTLDGEARAMIDWWRPIYESHLLSTLQREKYDAAMAAYNSPKAVAEREKAYKKWIDIQMNRPEALEYKKRNDELREAWNSGFTGTHEDLFGPWKDE